MCSPRHQHPPNISISVILFLLHFLPHFPFTPSRKHPVGSYPWFPPCSGRGIGRGAYQEEEARGPLLCANVFDRGGAEEDAAHWPEHVLPGRPGAHQHGQDTILSGTVLWVSLSGKAGVSRPLSTSLWGITVDTLCATRSRCLLVWCDSGRVSGWQAMANWNVFLPQRDTDEEVREFLHNNLHFQGKVSVV